MSIYTDRTTIRDLARAMTESEIREFVALLYRAGHTVAALDYLDAWTDPANQPCDTEPPPAGWGAPLQPPSPDDIRYEGCGIFEASGSGAVGDYQLQAHDAEPVFASDDEAWQWVWFNQDIDANAAILCDLATAAPEELCRIAWWIATGEPLNDLDLNWRLCR